MRLLRPTPPSQANEQISPTAPLQAESKPKPQWQTQAAAMHAWLDSLTPGAGVSVPTYSPTPTLRY